MALKLGLGHKVKPQQDIETTTFEEFITAYYGEDLDNEDFEPEIDFTVAEGENDKDYFTFWRDVDGEKYRQYIRVSGRIKSEADDQNELLSELAQNYPIYVAHKTRDGVELEVPTLTFSIIGERKAKKVSLKSIKLGEKVGKKASGLPTA